MYFDQHCYVARFETLFLVWLYDPALSMSPPKTPYEVVKAQGL